jgi:FkbM family methyltransferase
MNNFMGVYIFTAFQLLEKVAAYFQGKGYGTGTIKQEVATVLKQLGDQPHLVIDIGANIGKYSQELRKKQIDLEIHLFEPASFNVQKLKNAFSADPLITINPCGIANISGNATLFTNEPGSALASLTKRKLGHVGIDFDCQEDVKLIRFEDYWRSVLNCRAVDIVKLDIEGHELDALKSFGEALAVTKVIQFEFGGCNVDTKTNFQEFFYFFKDNGFALSRITPFGLEFITKYREIDEFYSTTNYVATNKIFLE